MHKVKLVMKRLRDVQPGDVYVGRGSPTLTGRHQVMDMFLKGTGASVGGGSRKHSTGTSPKRTNLN